MIHSFRRRILGGLVLGVLAGAGCGGGGADERGAAGAAGGADTTLEGLSRDQIRQMAEPMSPEQAEQLGIVDTTIHLENLGDSDTLALPDTGGARPAPPQ